MTTTQALSSLITKKRLFFFCISLFLVSEVLIIGTNQDIFDKSLHILSQKHWWSSVWKGGRADADAAAADAGPGHGGGAGARDYDDIVGGGGRDYDDLVGGAGAGGFQHAAEARLRMFNMYPENYDEKADKRHPRLLAALKKR